MVRIIQTTPSLRHAIERERIVMNRHDNEKVIEAARPGQSLERMVAIALRKAAEQLGVNWRS